MIILESIMNKKVTNLFQSWYNSVIYDDDDDKW